MNPNQRNLRAGLIGGEHEDVAPVAVFIVDDHAGYRAAAAEVVEATPGFTVVGAADTGLSAVAAINALAEPPDLVLMDINLAGESGLDVTRSLSARHPATKFILISTLDTDELPDGAVECGAAGYVPKSRFGVGTLEAAWRGSYDWKP